MDWLRLNGVPIKNCSFLSLVLITTLCIYINNLTQQYVLIHFIFSTWSSNRCCAAYVQGLWHNRRAEDTAFVESDGVRVRQRRLGFDRDSIQGLDWQECQFSEKHGQYTYPNIIECIYTKKLNSNLVGNLVVGTFCFFQLVDWRGREAVEMGRSESSPLLAFGRRVLRTRLCRKCKRDSSAQVSNL